MKNNFFRYFILPGRVLFSLVFVINGIKHFTQDFINYGTSKGVIWSDMLVPASGALAVLGGLSVMFGYKANWGAFLIVLFLLPVTLVMHNFWALEDPMEKQLQSVMFLKNLSMLGGAMLISYFGAGAYRLDEMQLNRPKKESAVKRSTQKI